MNYDIEDIKSNWKKYEGLCLRLDSDNLNDLIKSLGERICMCPQSMRSSEPGAHPGGLVNHSLNVASAMRTINDAMNLEVSIASIFKVALLHEIGKIGDENLDLYVEQDSDWHVKNLGQYYKYNEDIPKMSISHRTLYLLQKFKIELERDEWIAIQISQGSHFEENRFYTNSEPTIAILLQKAKSLVNHRELLLL